MENELPVPHTSSSASVSSSTSGVSSSSGGSGRPTGPQISVYSGIPDRQTVQVRLQLIQGLQTLIISRASRKDMSTCSGKITCVSRMGIGRALVGICLCIIRGEVMLYGSNQRSLGKVGILSRSGKFLFYLVIGSQSTVLGR